MLEAVSELFSVRLTMINIDSQVMVFELEQKKETLTEMTVSLGLRPEGWQAGGKYSFRDFLKMLDSPLR